MAGTYERQSSHLTPQSSLEGVKVLKILKKKKKSLNCVFFLKCFVNCKMTLQYRVG